MFGASSLVNTKRGGTLVTYDLTTTIPSNIQTGDILNCPYSGTYKIITLPKGQYKLECWGAQGGYRNDSTQGGKGGYSVGTIILTTATTMYLYSGGAGNTGRANGGFNGGGLRDSYNGGGGASDIRIAANNLQSRVIVAGGGGSDGAPSRTGMYGGGTSGGTATQSFGSGGGGGTQTAGGAGGNNNSGSFGIGGKGINYASGYGGAGGGGWYGGGGAYPDDSGDDDRGGGGGSGFVWTGSNAPSSYRLGSQYYLSNANTIAGNTSFIGPTGEAETGHSGNGYVRITVIEAKTNLSIYIKNNTWKENSKILFKKTNWINHKNIYIKYNPQSLLPSGYTALEYIESTGTQYINTGFKPKTTSRIQMRALPTKTVSSYTAFFGCRTDSSPTASDSFNFAVTTATTIRSDYFGTNQSATVSTILTDTIIDKKQNILTAYGQTITNKAKTSEQSSKNNLTIFALNTASKNEINYYISMKLYYCKIWDNGSLVRNLIPAKNSSGTLGLYDAVNNTFYTNAGTGTFTAGPIATTSWVKIGSL